MNIGEGLVPCFLTAVIVVLVLVYDVMADGPTPPGRERVYHLTALVDLACFICFLVIFVRGGRYRGVLCLGLTALYLAVSYALYVERRANLGGPSNIGELPINLFLLAAFVILTGLGLIVSLVFGLLQWRASCPGPWQAAMKWVRPVVKWGGAVVCGVALVLFVVSVTVPFHLYWQ